MTETVSLPAPASRHGSDSGPASPAGPSPEHPADPAAASGPAEAFDLLYARHAAPLFRQAWLLTGDRHLAGRSVTHAFRLAWERWPEVAVDRDPAGWVRAAVHEYALSPWHRLLPRRRTPGKDGTAESGARENGRAEDRPEPDKPERDGACESGGTLPLEALLRLPPCYRRTLLLHDGIGLGLPETAAESEASTPAAAGRLLHAREALAQYAPGLSRVAPDRRREMIRSMLEGLAAARPAAEVPPARAVRSGGEALVRRRTGAAVGLTALLAVMVAVTSATGPRGHVPPQKTPAVSVHFPDRAVPDDLADG
ncbi:MAG TPA: hypothetical protein VFY14_03595 [Streptomyces sp.]|nr:hypothetical protein [Streptomyces sp.]